MSSSSFRRGTSLLPSATDLDESHIASLLLAMSHCPVVHAVNACASSLSKNTKISSHSLPLHLPAEELTVDTATAAAAVAAVAAPTEVSTFRVGGAGGAGSSMILFL